jgi:glycosyltransferase involved in cell wall biosynthesis
MEILLSRGVAAQLLLLGAQDETDSSTYVYDLTQGKPWVRVLNHVADVRPYLACSKVVALPTRREGFPNVILEAAAMGIPAVTTATTGAIDSIVDGVTGLLVPPDDPYALAAALAELLCNDGRREAMGRQARDRVVNEFQPSDVASDVVTLAVGNLPPRSFGVGR